MSLPERVEGVPNFRTAPLLFAVPETPPSNLMVYGTGMPTVDGLRRGLERMGARHKRVVWTSMREEPVIFISGGRPHVLRLFNAPLENVITTGVTAGEPLFFLLVLQLFHRIDVCWPALDTVESMEKALKADLCLEAKHNGGKVLLHDEIEEADGSFTIIAAWEDISE